MIQGKFIRSAVAAAAFMGLAWSAEAAGGATHQQRHRPGARRVWLGRLKPLAGQHRLRHRQLRQQPAGRDTIITMVDITPRPTLRAMRRRPAGRIALMLHTTHTGTT